MLSAMVRLLYINLERIRFGPRMNKKPFFDRFWRLGARKDRAPAAEAISKSSWGLNNQPLTRVKDSNLRLVVLSLPVFFRVIESFWRIKLSFSFSASISWNGQGQFNFSDFGSKTFEGNFNQSLHNIFLNIYIYICMFAQTKQFQNIYIYTHLFGAPPVRKSLKAIQLRQRCRNKGQWTHSKFFQTPSWGVLAKCPVFVGWFLVSEIYKYMHQRFFGF